MYLRIYHHLGCYTLLILFFMLYTAINVEYFAFHLVPRLYNLRHSDDFPWLSSQLLYIHIYLLPDKQRFLLTPPPPPLHPTP